MACEFCAHLDDEPRNPSDQIDQSALMSLVAAIGSGSVADASLCLDVVFRDDARAREWIALARAQAMRRAA